MAKKAPLKVLCIAGSLRTGSYNRKALQVVKKIASDAGANVTEVDLKVLALPVYDGDVEDAGFPDSAQTLKDAIVRSDVLLIATPEYNNSIPGGLKNAIDWASRDPNAWEGKIAAIFGASDGSFGTVRSQIHLREVLSNLGVLVVPTPRVFIKFDEEAFTPEGAFKDPKTHQLLEKLVRRTLAIAAKLGTW